MFQKIENRKARYDYFIEDTLECGIALKGNEVKSIRDGLASIKESWIAIENGELYIKQMYIKPWSSANVFDVDEKRARKLLAHKKEIRELEQKVSYKGYTLVPLEIYLSGRNIKVKVGLCRGKSNYDKRQTIKERDLDRQTRAYVST